MLTDAQVRDLLHRAAETIDVAPAPPGAPARRPRWGRVLVGAAAAAVLVVSVGVTALRDDDGDRPEPTVPRAEVRIPSLLGYTRDEARAELERLGLRTKTEGDGGGYCSVLADPVTGTRPDPGTSVPAGSTVVLEGAEPDVAAECEYGYDVATRLLRFARGLDPLPVAPTGLMVRTPEGRVRLTADEARYRASWTVCRDQVCRSPLQALIDRVDAVRGEAHLSVTSGCLRPPGVVSVGVIGASSGAGDRCGVVDLRLDGRGRLTAVDLTDPTLGEVGPRRAPGDLQMTPQ